MNDEKTGLNSATRPVHLVGFGACVLVVAAASALFLVPSLRAARASNAATVELATLTGSLVQAAGMNRALTAQIEQLEASLRTRGVALDGIDELNGRLADLTTLCVENGLIPEIIQPRQAITDGPTTVVPIRFEVLGSLGALDHLLGVFDERFPDLHIQELTIEHTGPETLRLRSVLWWLTKPES
jgi:Tfp pilus assembly protein PilO